MSRGVHRAYTLSVSECPPVPSRRDAVWGTVCTRLPERSSHTLKDTIRPLGENALSEEILRWLFHCFLVNAVVFLSLTVRQRTHQNAIQFSRYYRKYITLTYIFQEAILRIWTRNQNKRPCGLPSKIWKPLLAFERCMGVSQIRRLFAWPCELSQGKSGLPIHHAPNIPAMNDGAFWVVSCKIRMIRYRQPFTLNRTWFFQ
jgi:hypothetical protein